MSHLTVPKTNNCMRIPLSSMVSGKRSVVAAPPEGASPSFSSPQLLIARLKSKLIINKNMARSNIKQFKSSHILLTEPHQRTAYDEMLFFWGLQELARARESTSSGIFLIFQKEEMGAKSRRRRGEV